MALVTCKECKSKVSTKAGTCPTCGAKQRRTSGCAIAFVLILGIFLVVMVFSSSTSESTSTAPLPPQPRPSNVDQEMGLQFIGLTKEQLIEKLGKPASTIKDSNPQDGNFEIFTYDNTKGNVTLFVIWESDGTVSSGQYKGKHFFKKQ